MLSTQINYDSVFNTSKNITISIAVCLKGHPNGNIYLMHL